MNKLYPELVSECLRLGEGHVPHEETCVERRPAVFTLKTPSTALYTGDDRRLNYRFWAVETLGYLAGVDDEWYADLLVDANPRISRWRNPKTKRFDGAYGPRLKLSLPGIEELLRREPDSRQAVASIRPPGMPDSSLDIPCTVALQFLRSAAGDLDLLVYMRSNDLDWGVPYDVPAFCSLQAVMAGCLGWPIGTYTHVAGSLHLYETHRPEFYPHARFASLQVPQLRWSADNSCEVLIDQALAFLTSLAVHRSEGRPWADFGVSVVSGLNDDYWRQWVNTVRFSWKAWEELQK